MQRDKRKGLRVGYKKLGPSGRFAINLGVVGVLGSVISFTIQTISGPTRANQLEIIEALDAEMNDPTLLGAETLETQPANEVVEQQQNAQPELLNAMTKNTGKEYERFVYEIYTTLVKDDRFSSVEHDVQLEGKDGPRQIDVLLQTHVANADLLMVIECRDYAKRLDITHIDAFHSKLRDVNASKGILVSRKGFSKMAKDKANRLGIVLCIASDAQEVMDGVGLKLPVRVNMIKSSFLVTCKLGDDAVGIRPTSNRESLTFNGIYLFDQFHKDLHSGLNIKIPTASSKVKWLPSDIHPPYTVINELGQPITLESAEFFVRHEVRYFFGYIDDIPGVAALHNFNSNSTTFAFKQIEASKIMSKLSEYKTSESRPETPYLINCLESRPVNKEGS